MPHLMRTAQKRNIRHLTRSFYNPAFSASEKPVRRRGLLVETADVKKDGGVTLLFRDGTSAQYHPLWLRLKCATNSWKKNPEWNRVSPMDLDNQQVQMFDVVYCSFFYVYVDSST